MKKAGRNRVPEGAVAASPSPHPPGRTIAARRGGISTRPGECPCFEWLEERLLLSASFPPGYAAGPLIADIFPQLAPSLASPFGDADSSVPYDNSPGGFDFVVESFTPLGTPDLAAEAASPLGNLNAPVRNVSAPTAPGDAPRTPAPPASPAAAAGGASSVDSAGAAAKGEAGAAHTNFVIEKVSPSNTTPPGNAKTPAQIRAAYGFDQVMFGSIPGDGTGQTIAIIDAYDYPTALSDLNTFSAQYNLPQFNVTGGPTFTKVGQTGGSVPGTDPAGAGNPNGTWEGEEALDIEWAHAVAPSANILLVEANDPSTTNLVQGAVNWARSQPGVVAVSMSFSGNEFSGETIYDTYFTTPSGHAGVTFFAATGDAGQPSGYPAYSPNVVAVGGTTLTLSGSSYGSESGWSSSGGGISVYESQPAYQSGVVTQSTTSRTNPDVALDADPSSGVAVYDSWDYPTSAWGQYGGTSLATPMWAGLMAIVDQGRSLQGLSAMDGKTQTLPTLYQLPAADFHDITTGNNGYAAGPGYDLVTGLGTPVANKLVFDLGGLGSISGTVFSDSNGNGVMDAGESPLPGVTVFLDTNNNGVLDPAATTTVVSTNVPKSIPDNNTGGVTSTLTFAGSAALITDINITLSITHPHDSDLTAYLIGPDGTQVTLFSRIGGSGANFTNTTFDDQAATSITAASAPYTGAFKPSPGPLSAFNGKTALGTWRLKVVDSRRNNTGSITGWSLTVTTAGEASTVTDASGHFAFNNVSPGTYYVRQLVPANDVQTVPNPGATPAGANVVTVSGQMTGLNFGDFSTIVTAPGAADSYYVRLDPTGTYVQISAGAAPLPQPTYQIALSLLPSLTFNLQGASNSIYFDYVNGSPAPAGNIAVNAAVNSNDALQLFGQSATQAFTMTSTQIAPATGGAVVYQNLASMWFYNCTVSALGFPSTLQSLYIGQGATFILG
jgi:subtilisin-like proprotein convertase family protein